MVDLKYFSSFAAALVYIPEPFRVGDCKRLVEYGAGCIKFYHRIFLVIQLTGGRQTLALSLP
jgi:hypothetical protein